MLAKPFYVGTTGMQLPKATQSAVAFGATVKPASNDRIPFLIYEKN